MKNEIYISITGKRLIYDMTPYVEINAQILPWANATFGFTNEKVATMMNLGVEVVQSWVLGSSYPTYAQLERLAYEIYKVPIATFFLSDIPIVESPKARFRTNPGLAQIEYDYGFIRIIRKAFARQLYLQEVDEKAGLLPSDRSIKMLFGSVTTKNSPSILAKTIREILGVTIGIQSQWGKPETALDEWRHLLFNKGIYTFKEPFKNDNIAGFCVSSNSYPVIFINNSTTKTRQIFTVFHELAHLILGNDTIDDMSEIESVQSTEVNSCVEVFCNQFASECLVPIEDIKEFMAHIDEESIYQLANKFGVSREVILRKLFDNGYVSNNEYEQLTTKWNSQIVKGKGGGDYYKNQVQYLGKDYTYVVISGYMNGKIDIYDTANYLSISHDKVAKLQKHLGLI